MATEVFELKDYQMAFIDVADAEGALQLKDRKLKSGRDSPWFFNMGDICSGKGIGVLGDCYARKIADSFGDTFDVIFGPAYKGIPIAAVAVDRLNSQFGMNKRFAYNRKEAKLHGEATKESLKKELLVGDIRNGDRVILLDDVVTTGGTKYDSIEILNGALDNLKYVGIVVGADREEVGESGVGAVEELEKNTGMPVRAIVGGRHIFKHQSNKGKVSPERKQKIVDYMTRYGTPVAKRFVAEWSQEEATQAA